MGDLRRVFSNVVTGLIVLGLVMMPSIFSWYNVVAAWDVFGNTGNLKVAVANTDDGYKSDLVPLEMNVGEQVVSALRANDQLDWVFTSEEDAIDGARSGKYYAAVVIPSSFSKDMMTFYDDDVEHAEIVYYTNEKKNAVSPKVTDQGADQVSYQVNMVFAETLSKTALAIAESLMQYADSSDVNGAIGKLANHVGTMGTQMSQTASVLDTYATLMGSSQSLVDSSSNLLGQARSSVDDVSATAGQGKESVSSIADAMEQSSAALSEALQKSSESYGAVSDAIDQAYSSAGQFAGDSSAALRDKAATVDYQASKMREIHDALTALVLPGGYQPVLADVIDKLNTAIDLQTQLADSLRKAADGIDSGNADAQAQHDEAQRLAAEAKASVSGLTTSYNEDIKPKMDELESQVSSLVASLSGSADTLKAAGDDLSGTADSVSEKLGDAQGKLKAAADGLRTSSQKMADLSTAISGALSSGDVEQLRQVLGSDPGSFAAAIASPVQLDRHALFAADNFGSQMAPLYTTLAVWVGALLLSVVLKVIVSPRAQAELDNPKPRQLYLGRFGVFSVISLMQTTVLALGNMLFVGVQVEHPLLYLACFWIGGLVFSFMIYTLVVSFANLGKAISVLLLILQVTAGGGSFPLPILPEFFQMLSPFVPATHMINAMRAAMMGVYQGDFWIEIGKLLLFLVPTLLLGLVLRKPTDGFLRWYVRKAEESKLVS